MKILTMRASFGRLQNETLTLHEGLNILQRPNEGGKSTWSAFLLAMLYGVDSSERASKNNLPVKTHFRPWSGAPMEGSMELEWNGRRITIERSSTARAPMSVFCAYDSESGLPIAELTGENCGRVLLGVERSVFERSAFIRQSGLAVTADKGLEQRLHALVTTGEEQLSYTEAERALRGSLNHIARGRSGALDQLQAELDAVDDTLQRLQAIAQENYSLRERREPLLARLHALQQAQQAAEAAEAAEKRRQLAQAQQAVQARRAELQALKAQADALPSLAELRALERQLLTLPEAPEPPEEEPVDIPAAPPALQGLSPEAAQATLQEDLAALDACSEPARASKLLPLLGALLAVAGLFLLRPLLSLGLALTASGLIVGIFGLLRLSRAHRLGAQRAQQRQALLARYEAADRDDVIRRCEQYRNACAAYRQQLALAQQSQERYAQQLQAVQTARDTFFAALSAFSDARTRADAEQALTQALALRSRCEEAEHALAQAEQTLAALRAAIGSVDLQDESLPAAPPDGLPAFDPQEYHRLQEELRQLDSRLDRQQGQLAALGDPAALSARREQLTARRQTLCLHRDALTAALDALHTANEEVQTRFSPALNREASRLMERLTGGRYDQVLLQAGFSAGARLRGQALQRPLNYLSAGTADQLYLALRLAICNLALPEPEDVPLILDDALALFDDDRCRTALQLLTELACERQILLFTCQSREAQLLAQN